MINMTNMIINDIILIIKKCNYTNDESGVNDLCTDLLLYFKTHNEYLHYHKCTILDIITTDGKGDNNAYVSYLYNNVENSVSLAEFIINFFSDEQIRSCKLDNIINPKEQNNMIDCTNFTNGEYPILTDGMDVGLYNGTRGIITLLSSHSFEINNTEFHLMDIKVIYQ